MKLTKIDLDNYDFIEVEEVSQMEDEKTRIRVVSRSIQNEVEFENWNYGDSLQEVLPIFEEKDMHLYLSYPQLKEFIAALQEQAKKLKPGYDKERARHKKEMEEWEKKYNAKTKKKKTKKTSKKKSKKQE